MISYQIINNTKKYLEKDTHRIASKKLCSKTIFEIKVVKDTKTLTYIDKIFYGEIFIEVEKQANTLVLKV